MTALSGTVRDSSLLTTACCPALYKPQTVHRESVSKDTIPIIKLPAVLYTPCQKNPATPAYGSGYILFF